MRRFFCPLQMHSQRFRHPNQGVVATLINYLTNARWLALLRRAVLSRLPSMVLESDVRDVLYTTWLVDAEMARKLAPPGAKLLEAGGKTPFTILSYRHGHFGPAFLGVLRRLFPSPLQSNWRLYLAQPIAGADAVSTVAFVQNVLSSQLYALCTRVFSDALLAHLAQRFVLTRSAQEVRVEIDPGAGSAPRLQVLARASVNATLPHGFAEHYPSWEAAVLALCLQDAAVCQIPDSARLAFARIDLPVELQHVQPFTLLSSDCPMLAALAAEPEALCFFLPSVRFRVLSERVITPYG